MTKKIFSILLVVFLFIRIDASAQTNQRARDLGIQFDGTTGKYNAITDVPGVLVGYKTLIKGDGELVVGKGPVRTGVTVIFPRGKILDTVPAATFSFNGDGEMTGINFIEDYGFNYGAIGITNSNSIGIVRDAIGAWETNHFYHHTLEEDPFGLPVVAETWDGDMNDIFGQHVTQQDVFDAMDSAHSGFIEEGNVGGGTGMRLFRFKGGSGTSSRIIKIDSTQYTVGVFVQANFGLRNELTIRGVPVGKEIQDLMPIQNEPKKDGSIIIIVATDAPLLPTQLKQIAKHATLGLARTGSISHSSSGDIFLAFSTQMPKSNQSHVVQTWQSISQDFIDPIYEATVQTTEEAIINVLVAAKTMVGINGNTLYGIPHDRLMQVMKKYNR